MWKVMKRKSSRGCFRSSGETRSAFSFWITILRFWRREALKLENSTGNCWKPGCRRLERKVGYTRSIPACADPLAIFLQRKSSTSDELMDQGPVGPDPDCSTGCRRDANENQPVASRHPARVGGCLRR